MKKFLLDVAHLEKNLDKMNQDRVVQASVHRVEYQKSKALFKRVAFDLFEPSNGNDEIWQLQADADGKEWLVQVQSVGESEVKVEGGFSAHLNSKRTAITLLHNNEPIMKFASEDFNFTPDTANSFRKFLLKRVDDPKFVTALWNEVEPEKKKARLQ